MQVEQSIPMLVTFNKHYQNYRHTDIDRNGDHEIDPTIWWKQPMEGERSANDGYKHYTGPDANLIEPIDPADIDLFKS